MAASSSKSSTSPTRSEFVFVNGVPTYVVKYGATDLLAAESDSLILVIPGNPGIIGFYEEFMEAVHELSGRGLPVWGVSHAGHVAVPRHVDNTPDYTPTKRQTSFNLDYQIQHKLDFIRQYIPSKTSIIIVSHSIGSHMALHVLKQVQEQKLAVNIEKIMMLFPTIRHMALSPHGRLARPLLSYFQWFVNFLVLLLSYLSPLVQYRMILWYFSGRNVAECAYNAALNLFNPSCVHNVMFLADHELREVLEPDYEVLSDNIGKFIFYYGRSDQWAPVSYHDDLKEIFPDGEIYLCNRGCEHAFVLRNSQEMAELVWEWTRKALGA